MNKSSDEQRQRWSFKQYYYSNWHTRSELNLTEKYIRIESSLFRLEFHGDWIGPFSM